MSVKSFRHLCMNEKLILFILISLYLTLELLNIKLLGLSDTEALPACGSLQILKRMEPIMFSIKIFNINFPIMLCQYHTALESYILLPFLWLFGINVITLRSVPIVIGAFTLIFTYMFLKESFDKKVAVLTLFLLIINSTFLLQTQLGLDSASMFQFTAMGALLSLWRWYKGKGDSYFYLGIFLLGLGISIRVWFLWFVNGMFFLAMIFRRKLKDRMKGNLRKYIIIGVMVFCLGIFLFICYNFKTGFDTVHYIIKHFSQTRTGVNNFRYITNLKHRLPVFIGYLRGSWPFFHFSKSSQFYPYILLGALIWLVSAIIFKKIKFSKTRVSLVIILFLSILLQSPFTLSHFGEAHLFILYPLIQIILALALTDIIIKLKTNKIILAIVGFIFLIFVFLEFINLKDNYLYFKKFGGRGRYWSDSIYSVSRYLEENRIYNPIVMQWGFSQSLIFLSQGRIIPKTFDYELSGTKKESFIRECKSILKEPNIYVFYAPRFTDDVYSVFAKISRELGKTIQTEKVFCRRDGTAIYVVYSVN